MWLGFFISLNIVPSFFRLHQNTKVLLVFCYFDSLNCLIVFYLSLPLNLKKNFYNNTNIHYLFSRCGNIAEITSGSSYDESDFEQVVDGRGCCLLPGLVDGHTHPVWSGDRVGEFAMKLAGKTYMEIHKV